MDGALLGRLDLGDHVCRLYRDDEQRLATVAGFVEAGVGSGHQVAYFSVERPETVLEQLGSRGVDGRALIERGGLRVTSAQDSYLASGAFHPEAVMSAWRRAIADARDCGYAGLWAMGDMAWAATKIAGADRLRWYEAEVNRVFTGEHALALCLYDERSFPADELDRIAAAHPGTLEPGDGPGWRPLLRMRRTVDPPGLKLTGEADASNRDALAATLDGLRDDLPRTGAPATLDLTDLRFADAAVARLLIRAARTFPAGMRIAGCSPWIARLLTLLGGDQIPGVDAAEARETTA
ncbi:MEDS domain-containing protein [Microbispora sp. NPDC049125]|uniref:MEDS domain-containing protein n=1 Tax=Microbispora sp. NPDC049125 TaxID=3154929 RepID=UPI003466EAC4